MMSIFDKLKKPAAGTATALIQVKTTFNQFHSNQSFHR